jgi:integrase
MDFYTSRIDRVPGLLPVLTHSVSHFLAHFGGAMNYLLKRGDWYYFNRKVPAELECFDCRKLVRFSLKTDSRKEAVRLMVMHNEKLENYWKGLVRSGQNHTASVFEKIVQLARLEGFSYLPNAQIAALPLLDIQKRFAAVEKNIDDEKHVVAVMGGADYPKLMLVDVYDKFIGYSSPRTLNKSPNQVRKWVNPRKLALRNFIDCVGNKEFSSLNRDDILKFRDWWIGRVKSGNAIAGTANKNLINVKNIIETVNDNLGTKLDTQQLFKKLLLPSDNDGQRLPFTTDYILSTLLKPESLSGLNEQARWVLHAIAETGAGISEQVGLMAEDIVLDHDIPHIIIRPRKNKSLKTAYRKREIPLVGFALDAFRACPNGFTDYHDKPDSLSSALNKYLNENGLMPSDKHTVYSLRHSFQDRLLAANAPDRVQADLMGHKFHRPYYGDGASLKQKLEWLEKVKLKNT